MSNPSAYDLGSYQPKHQPPPANLGPYPALEPSILDTLDRLEIDFPNLSNNTAQAIAHVLAYTQTQAPGLLDLAVQFANREHTNARSGQNP